MRSSSKTVLRYNGLPQAEAEAILSICSGESPLRYSASQSLIRVFLFSTVSGSTVQTRQLRFFKASSCSPGITLKMALTFSGQKLGSQLLCWASIWLSPSSTSNSGSLARTLPSHNGKSLMTSSALLGIISVSPVRSLISVMIRRRIATGSASPEMPT